MKRILTLVLCWLLVFETFAETTFKAKTAASVAGGYVTSLNKVDGSFEDGTTGWVASVGTITATASTELQGNFKGVWAGTGTGTLDLQWTATASNTYELSAQVNVKGEDDVSACTYVGTTETGCKLIPALNKIQKVSVVADSVLSSAFNLRLKHTGSDAFSVDVDDGKIEPWTPQSIGVVQQESITYTGYSGKDGSNNLKFKTLYKDTGLSLVEDDNTGNFTKFKLLKKAVVVISTSTSYGGSTAHSATINHYNSSGVLQSGSQTGGQYSVGVPHTIEGNAGDYFVVNCDVVPADNAYTNFSITAQAVSDNVIQTWQPSGSLGELKFLPQNIAPQGFIPAMGSSIGKTAGTYQGDQYFDLYKVLWTQSSVTAGEPYVISSAKGADAATDWAANKTITIDVSGLVVRAYKSGTTGAVGAKQADAFQGHWHDFYATNYKYGGNTASAGSGIDPDFGTANTLTSSGQVRASKTDGTNGTPRTASETRMTNIAQYAFIRYGNDAPTLLALPNGTETDYYIEAAGYGSSVSLTAGVTNIPFTPITNKNLVFNGTTLTAPIEGNYEISGSVGLTTTFNANVGLYKNGVLHKILSNFTSGGTEKVFSGKVYLNQNEYISLRLVGNGGSSSTNSAYHHLSITRLNGKIDKTFISNINPDGFNRTSGVTGLVESFSFSYGTTNATTVCSASPCSYLDQIGTNVTSVTRTSAGTYSINFNKTYSKIKCSGNAYAAGNRVVTPIRCENCSSATFTTLNVDTPSDAFGTITCQGQ